MLLLVNKANCNFLVLYFSCWLTYSHDVDSVPANYFCSLKAPRTSRRVTGPIQIDDLQSFEAAGDLVQKSSGSLSSTTTTLTPPTTDLSNPSIATTSYNFRDSSHTASYAQAPLTNNGRPITQVFFFKLLYGLHFLRDSLQIYSSAVTLHLANTWTRKMSSQGRVGRFEWFRLFKWYIYHFCSLLPK